MIALLTLTVACSGDSSPAEPPADPLEAATSADIADNLPRSTDAQFARLAREIPGFGGVFLDKSGRANVYLVDLAQKARAEAVLRVWLRQYPSGGRQGHPLEQGIQVRKGDYDFLQLLEWRHRARSLFSLSDVIFLDVDEQRNRVAIGVRNITALQPIIRELANQGIPREAVIFEESGPARPRTTLQDRERPTAGGLRINRLGDGCTLGFNAYAGGVKTFVTNSHCTTVRSEPDNTDFFQVNLDSSADYIGRETADPPFFTGGACPSGRKCRYSDAALVGYSEPAGSEWDFGGIARPITFDV